MYDVTFDRVSQFLIHLHHSSSHHSWLPFNFCFTQSSFCLAFSRMLRRYMKQKTLIRIHLHSTVIRVTVKKSRRSSRSIFRTNFLCNSCKTSCSFQILPFCPLWHLRCFWGLRRSCFFTPVFNGYKITVSNELSTVRYLWKQVGKNWEASFNHLF